MRINCFLSILSQEFKTAMECDSSFEQVDRDFSRFDERSFLENNEMVKERFTKNPGATSLCHYVIKDQKIFRKCYGHHVGFNMFSRGIYNFYEIFENLMFLIFDFGNFGIFVQMFYF